MSPLVPLLQTTNHDPEESRQEGSRDFPRGGGIDEWARNAVAPRKHSWQRAQAPFLPEEEELFLNGCLMGRHAKLHRLGLIRTGMLIGDFRKGRPKQIRWKST
ncbi:hypothetical protein CEXT_13661 [Caerostris extrusa]|uniref:Uncharacterized protein n=1 Tax=Caerostris extrusa TaxID=172846 RepID=A0AAV4YCP1_CAEEX|nr:hypothetical protein CEXT_13661 [Caerostris extrusa]